VGKTYDAALRPLCSEPYCHNTTHEHVGDGPGVSWKDYSFLVKIPRNNGEKT
jgi:hypothetical protein